MRRLTEILAFPKAWYRRSIARRMFLGDQSSTGALFSDQGKFFSKEIKFYFKPYRIIL